MNIDLLLALIGFSFVSSITPGPNNLMLMASGANFGVLRTVPHMLGVGIGFSLMIVVVGLGLVELFDRYPVSYRILSVVSVVYLLWLAFRIATAAPRAPDAPETGGRPLSFWVAAAFQWVNPKAWFMALTSLTNYAPDQTVAGVFVVAAVFGIINLPCVSSWTILGQQMRRFLGTPARLRAFNWTMALLLVLTLVPILFPEATR